MSAPDREIAALRTAAGVTRLDHVRALRLRGPGAVDLLDALVTSRLFIRENQMLHTLMLDEQAGVFADLFVCQEEESLLVLAEGPTPAGLLARVWG